jgi:large subunit ribosomal protein L23
MSKKSTAKKAVNPALYELIRRPIITEKATMASEFGKVVFQVSDCATKQTVKEAIETLFDVKVTKVNTINLKGKIKRFRGMEGKRNGYKKAIVTLAEGQTIDAMAGVK